MGRQRKVSTSELLGVFAERRDPFEPLTASEVADEVGLTRRAVSDRLGELADESPPILRTKKTGAKGRVWWINADIWFPEQSTIELQDIAVERVLERVRGHTLGTESDRGELDDDQVVERALNDIDLPGNGELLVARRDAIRDIYRHIRQERQATKQELCELVDPQAVGYRDTESFWSNLIIRKNVMRALPNVVPPGEGGHYYHYVADA